MFGAEAIIKSSILFKPNALFTEWGKLLDLVFDLAKKKPWIREECGWIIYRSIHDLSSQKENVKFAEGALERLCSNDLARTPEGVSIWLAAKDMFPNTSFPSKIWKHDDPLDSKERNQLAKVMKESSSAEPDDRDQNNAKSSGVWNSKLHFAWEAILVRLSDAKKEKSKSSSSRLTFADFWADVVDSEFAYFILLIISNVALLQMAFLLPPPLKNASIGDSFFSSKSLMMVPFRRLLKCLQRTL